MILICLLASERASAQSKLHPAVPLKDPQGKSVLRSGRPVSPARSCAPCHDTKHIAAHSYHALAGSAEESKGWRAWDHGPGLLGRWEPLLYRRPQARGEWVRLLGARHVGGGPAAPSVEMNCFLCHTPRPNNQARIAELRAGRGAWAATATLAGTGLVRRTAKGWRWQPEAFDAQGAAPRERLQLGDPRATNCGLCHGRVHLGRAPLVVRSGLSAWDTETKGQVFSPQRICDSGMNVAGKADLTRPWDVHAERLMTCTSCHPSLDNPATFRERDQTRPAHLRGGGRRLTIGAFLSQPSHHFAKGDPAQGTVARRLAGSMRGCADCHDAGATHASWLPQTTRHLQRLDCAACHVPRVHAPARRATDWTTVDREGRPRIEYRGVEGPVDDPRSLVRGYVPALLVRRPRAGGAAKLVPHNLVTTWFWVSGEPAAPVPLEKLTQALFSGRRPHPDVLAALDADGDGVTSPRERVLDTAAKVAAVRARLEAVGISRPRIVGEVQPYGVHHGVASGRFATRACQACHGSGSRLAAPFLLADGVPHGARAALVGDANVTLGALARDARGRLELRPAPEEEGYHVVGQASSLWIDVLGVLAVLGAAAGALLHGGLRVLAARAAARERAL